MGIPLLSDNDHTAIHIMTPAHGTEVDFEQDAHLKRMLERKHKLEEAELYNSPETMLKKRKAVEEQARTVPPPKRSPSTDLNFDDNIDATPVDSHAAEPNKSSIKMKQKPTMTKSLPDSNHRTARRSRTASRRREAKAPNKGVDVTEGQLTLTTRRGKKKLRRLKEGKADEEQPLTQLEA